jgi:2-polyprenyl-3-methyl-5-hydroxy-6-metoxy-1,4-benzoquinol methylase
MSERRAAAEPGYYGKERSDLLQYVPEKVERVLEIGCGEGSFGAALKARSGCHVTGIELVEKAASVATGRLDEVLVGDAIQVAASLGPERFDLVVMNDVLEHFASPETVLRIYAEKLTPDGRFLLTVPSIRHWSVLAPLVLGGRFTYRDEGLLDRTHLRFFTRRSLLELLESIGLDVRSVALHIGKGSKSDLANRLTLGFAREFLAPHVVVLAAPRR